MIFFVLCLSDYAENWIIYNKIFEEILVGCRYWLDVKS